MEVGHVYHLYNVASEHQAYVHVYRNDNITQIDLNTCTSICSKVLTTFSLSNIFGKLNVKALTEGFQHLSIHNVAYKWV